VFGYQFAPRYQDLHKKIDGLIGFQHPKHYGDCLIKPGRKAYGELICKEWPNIQRIMASLGTRLHASFGCVFAQFLQKPQQCQPFVF
jgi:hypothetical protein